MKFWLAVFELLLLIGLVGLIVALIWSPSPKMLKLLVSIIVVLIGNSVMLKAIMEVDKEIKEKEGK